MGRDTTPAKPFADNKTYWLKGRTLNSMWAAIRANKPLPGVGTETRQTHDGIEISVPIAREVPSLVPWTLRVGSGPTKRLVSPGTAFNRVPTIGGVRIDAPTPPELSIFLGSHHYIYLRTEVAYDFIDGFIAGFSVSQGNVILIASMVANPSTLDEPEFGLFHTHMHTISASGEVLAQFHHESIEGTVADTGVGASVGQLSVFT